MTNEERVLDSLKYWEDDFLNPSRFAVNRINPFLTVGISLKRLAYSAEIVKPENDNGRILADLPAIRKIVKSLVAQGKVEAFGTQRTLHCGSRPVECYVLPGFQDRAEQVAKDLNII